MGNIIIAKQKYQCLVLELTVLVIVLSRADQIFTTWTISCVEKHYINSLLG